MVDMKVDFEVRIRKDFVVGFFLVEEFFNKVFEYVFLLG